MCEVSREIESRPPLMAALVEIRQTMKRLLRAVHAPQPEAAHGTATDVRHA